MGGALAGPVRAGAASVYWGAYIKGDTYGYGDAPFDTRTIDAFESHAGKGVSIVHWGQAWYWGSRGGYQPFQRTEAERVRQRGSIPMITWTSDDEDKGGSVNQPSFRLAAITAGQHDAYIRQWARDAKAWGYPFFVRFDNEMNGNWYNWSERVNGNGSGQFVPMWRHVVDIFRQEGATNVTWVWAPNRTWATAPISLSGVYPGASYVDWAGISAYNWGTDPAKPGNVWQSFDEVFKDSYDALKQIAPGKPIMIAETAASEWGGSKASWIRDALQTKLPQSYQQIKAICWFNWNAPATTGRMDWTIESSSSATSAFRAGIASGYYAGRSFANLTRMSKVQSMSSTSNEVRNGSFETTGSPWYAPWTVRNDMGASFVRDTATVAAGAVSLRVSVGSSNPTRPWAVQVRQSGLPLSYRASYAVSFRAKASSARAVTLLVQGSTSPWTVYMQRDPVLSTGWTQYAFNFTAPRSDGSAMVAINLARSAGTVWLDDVSLTRK